MSTPGRTRKGGERMSNYLAIATTTATLRTLLQNAVTPNVPGVSANTTRPHAEVNDNPPTEITTYLFQVTLNAPGSNGDVPSGSPRRTHTSRATLSLPLLDFTGRSAQVR